MNVKKTLKLFSYGLPVAIVAFVMWEPHIQAMDVEQLNELPLYPGAHLGAEPIQPIPLLIDLDQDIVELGKKLFSDSRMSENGVSCISCHNLALAGTDGFEVSVDIRGGYDLMNTPTVFNAGLNPLLTWFGRSLTLEQQIENVLANPRHMNGDWENIIKRLNEDAEYSALFEKLFDDGLSRDNIKYAIACFERSLITPNSAFDQYLRGDVTAITKDQKKGYELFKQYGCIACHQGMNVGGNLHAKLGTFVSPFENGESEIAQSGFNLGRYNLTGKEDDKYVFRVPSLRNVAKTAPYFHTGKVDDLEGAVKFMAKYQIGRDISDREAYLIAGFLRSLTGEYEGTLL